MTIASNDRYVSLSPAAGTTSLAWDFRLTRADGLIVERVRAGATATLVDGVDYILDSGWDGLSGGTLTLQVASLEDDEYRLIGAHPVERLSDFAAAQGFSSPKFNGDLDAATIMLQEHARDLRRAWKSDYGGTGKIIAPLPEGHFHKADADGNLVDGGSADDIEDAQENAATALAAAAEAVAAAAAAVAAAAGLSLPAIVTGDARKILVVNEGATGYALVPRSVLTPDMLGGTRYNTMEEAEDSGAVDSSEALEACLQSGRKVAQNGYYKSTAAISASDKEVAWKGFGPNGIVFTNAGNGVTIAQPETATINTKNYRKVWWESIGLYTTQQEPGEALQIAWNQSVVEFGRNEVLCLIHQADIQGTDPRANGWTRGIRITDVNYPMLSLCQVTGRTDSSATAGTLPVYMNGTDGLYFGVTGEIEMNYVQVWKARIKSCLTGIKAIGAGEGFIVTDTAIPVCNYGIDLDKTVTDPNELDPQVQISLTHINAATRAIRIKAMYEAQIKDNLLYAFPYVSTGTWAGIEGEKLLKANIGGNMFEAFPSTRADDHVGILGTDLRQTTIPDDNHYINITRPVELTSATCIENDIKPGKISPVSGVGAMVTYSGGADVTKNYSGPRSVKTAGVTVTSSTTSVAAISQDVWGGQKYKVEAVLRGQKGATRGNVVALIQKASGSATITFDTYNTTANMVEPSDNYTTAFVVYFSVTQSGTLGLQLQATSGGSDFAVSADQASITISKV